MRRLLLAIVVAVLGVGCASSRLEQRVAQLEQELATERAKETHAQFPTITSPETHAQRPVFGFVNYKPDFCSGALCLRIENHRPGPAVDIRVNGELVRLRQGAALFGGDAVYVRLVRPGRVVVQATIVDAVERPRGRAILTRTVLERCRNEFLIGTVADSSRGRSQATISAMDCASVAATASR